MRRSQPRWRIAALGIVVALTIAGCASGSPQTGASDFLHEHAAAAARLATQTKALEAEVARFSGSATGSQLLLLARAARELHPVLVRASEWSVAGQGQEGAEEEDVPRAETQVTAGADELAGAFAALQAYASAPSASALASYRSKLASARGQWNEGIAQLWYLAHTSHVPTV